MTNNRERGTGWPLRAGAYWLRLKHFPTRWIPFAWDDVLDLQKRGGEPPIQWVRIDEPEMTVGELPPGTRFAFRSGEYIVVDNEDDEPGYRSVLHAETWMLDGILADAVPDRIISEPEEARR